MIIYKKFFTGTENYYIFYDQSNVIIYIAPQVFIITLLYINNYIALLYYKNYNYANDKFYISNLSIHWFYILYYILIHQLAITI